MQIVSNGDNLHEMLNSVFSDKNQKNTVKLVLSKHLRKDKNWLPKRGDCLIQVNLHLFDFLRDLKIWPFNIGDCLIQVAFNPSLAEHNMPS